MFHGVPACTHSYHAEADRFTTVKHTLHDGYVFSLKVLCIKKKRDLCKQIIKDMSLYNEEGANDAATTPFLYTCC